MFTRLRLAFHRRDTLKRIARHGWTGIYVGDYQSAPTWAYSIGFHASLGAPEVIFFDIPTASANGLLSAIYSDLKSGLILRDGEPWRPQEVDHPAVWRQVHPSRLYDNDPEQPWLGLAEDYAAMLAPEKGPITAFHLVMRDGDHRLPWETGYDERLRPLQRELYLPTPTAIPIADAPLPVAGGQKPS